MPQLLQNLQRYASNPLEFVNGAARVGSMIGNEIEYGRKQVNTFIEDVVPEPIINTLDNITNTLSTGYENSPVGALDQGAAIAADTVSKTTNSPALGIAAGFLLGMVDGSPGISVKKGSVKFKSQDQWDSQRGAVIRAKRTKVEDAKVAMENIEANNPGVSKKELKTKDMSGYKSEKRRYEDGQAEVSRAESNIVSPTADNPYAFPRNAPGAKQYKQEIKVANEALGRSIEQLDLHHLIPKGMSAAIYNRARDFIEKGLVDEKYLNRLAAKFKKVTGADTGDLRSGILPMRKPQHDAMHLEMRDQPNLTFKGENMEMMKEALTAKLKGIKNPKDFEIMLDSLLENDIKPLVENARNWENMDDLIKSESPLFTGLAKPLALQKKK